jgi:hypothetical protein
MPTIKINRTISITPEELWEVADLPKDGSVPTVEGVLRIYKHVIPEYDIVKKLDGYPKFSKNFNKKMFDFITNYDKIRNASLPYDKQYMAGGIWLNNGFSSIDETVPDDTIIVDMECELEEKEGESNNE